MSLTKSCLANSILLTLTFVQCKSALKTNYYRRVRATESFRNSREIDNPWIVVVKVSLTI